MADFQQIQSLTKGPNSQNGDNGSLPQNSATVLQEVNRYLIEKAVAERAKNVGLPYIDIEKFPINPDVLRLVAVEDAEKSLSVPFFKIGKKVRLAVYEPGRESFLSVLKRLQNDGYECELSLASDIGIRNALKLYTSGQLQVAQPVHNVVSLQDERLFEKELQNLIELKNKILKLPSEEALNELHVGAIRAGASDIHYQPEEKSCIVRFRIDGILHVVFELPNDIYHNFVNQLKYKSQMKLNVDNIPQDGRFYFMVNERRIDVRVSSLPTGFGESFVCRILDSGKTFKDFTMLGFMGQTMEHLKKAADLSYGMVLCTGPTGSGKTTTLYALLQGYNTPEKKIITLEDPVEYHIAGITQSQINEKRGYTFESGLRSILRQDPDVIMIGEIRDLATAQSAMQAALTGHVVLATLHTNTAVETIPRLLTIGVPAFMMAPALHTIVAQRLLRRVCPDCAEKRPLSAQEKKIFEETIAALSARGLQMAVPMPDTVPDGKGCENCNKTGYRGQMVLAEIFMVNDEVRSAILEGASATRLNELAQKQAMITMREDGILKALQGLTTLSEVYRVVSA